MGSVEGDLDSMLVSIVESGDDKQDDQIHEITSTRMKTRTKSTNEDKNVKSGDEQVDNSLTRTTMKSGNENVKKSMKTKAEKKSIPLELKIPDFTSIKVKTEPDVVVVSPIVQVVDSDSDCILVESDSDFDLGTVTDIKPKVDLSIVKKEKTEGGKAGKSKDSDKSAKDVICEMIQRNRQGRIICPLQCGKTFKSSGSMFKHIDDDICMKDVSERRTLECCIKGCTHTCVNMTSMRNHKLSHFNLKCFECPIPVCDKFFIHQSSLVNHKHTKHSDIFGQFPSIKKKKVSDKKKIDKKKKKKSRKEDKKEKPPPKFSSSDDDY